MEKLFQSLYDSEINLMMDWFWDGGFRFKFGAPIMDETISEITSHSLDECLLWIEKTAKELYPDSKFAKEYDSKETFETSARPLMKYLGHNHHPHTSAYIRNDLAELLEGQQVFGTKDYILD